MDVILKKITKHYTLAFLVFWLGAMLLANPETSALLTFVSVLLVHAWVYFVHRGLHIAKHYGVLDMLNTHMVYHHQHEKTIPRSLELFYETITDLAMNLSLFGVQKLCGINIIPLSVILLFSLAYMSIHIINYSMLGSTFHKRHHETLEKNFAPDAMDHLFGTNFNNEYEDLNPTTLNVFGAMFLLYPLKKYIM
jgi:hypothetical protein